MRRLRPTTGQPFLDKITAKPFGLIDSRDAPEITKSRFFSNSLPHATTYQEQELGINPRKRTYASLYAAAPEAYILEAENVFLFRGVLHSKSGEALADSFRIIDPQNGVLAGYNNRNPDVQPLNGWHFVHAPVPKPSPPLVYEDRVVPFFSSPKFGHWILEALTSLWAHEHGVRGKYMLYPNTQIPPFLEALAAPFGLSGSDFFSPTEYMLLKQVVLPSKVYMHSGGYISNRAKTVWKKVTDFHTSGKTKDLPRKIYISRKNIPIRPLLNEPRCEEIFSSYGFSSIQPENFSMSEQIQIFAQATHVAGPIGSAMHNLVWSRIPEQVKTLFLCPDSFLYSHNFFYLEQSFNRIPFSVYGTSAASPYTENPSSADWILDEANLKAAIEQWLDV